jgi:hypothetical protein
MKIRFEETYEDILFKHEPDQEDVISFLKLNWLTKESKCKLQKKLIILVKHLKYKYGF